MITQRHTTGSLTTITVPTAELLRYIDALKPYDAGVDFRGNANYASIHVETIAIRRAESVGALDELEAPCPSTHP